MFEAGTVDVLGPQVELCEIVQTLQMHDAGVGNPIATQAELMELMQRPQMFQSLIADSRSANEEKLQFAESAEFGGGGIAERLVRIDLVDNFFARRAQCSNMPQAT